MVNYEVLPHATNMYDAGTDYRNGHFADFSRYVDIKFKLDQNFINSYKTRVPPFGFNGLGELVYKRTYSRLLEDGSHEEWYQTVARVVEGTFTIQKRHQTAFQLAWNESERQKRAQMMFERIYDMKFLPPGRGLWAMGTKLTEERFLYAALNNCAFVSTQDMHNPQFGQKAMPFKFLIDMSMLGVGVGFDCRGADASPHDGSHIKVTQPQGFRKVTIPDSREGWVQSVEMLLNAYFEGTEEVEFDYSHIRPAGAPIHGFGGTCAGPEAVEKLHGAIRETLQPLVGKNITTTAIVDLMNFIGRCAVSGNARQTAEIAFGDHNSQEYLDLKNYEANPQRMEYGWVSNNSIFCEAGMDYGPAAERVALNGEPGFAWLDNMRHYGRMKDGRQEGIDGRSMGGNPCLEQTLESYELCCLVETFPNKHESLEDYMQSVQLAYEYAKTVTLTPTHCAPTNEIIARNRRIGTSMSGLAQFIEKRGLNTLAEWCEDTFQMIKGLDKELADRFRVTPSIKTTSIKPSGTVSLLAGATPGMHYPESRYCIRRIRMNKQSGMLLPLRDAGYHIEDDVSNQNNVVVSFPIDYGEGLRSLDTISMWEQLELAAFLQHHWADNQVSCTVTFDPKTEAQSLKHALTYYQYRLKGISFLPHLEDGAYPQMPIEKVTAEEYHALQSKLTMPRLNEAVNDDTKIERFCDSNVCQ
eukprot:Clim_evm14s88 gene=Clim_evmTU14s88